MKRRVYDKCSDKIKEKEKRSTNKKRQHMREEARKERQRWRERGRRKGGPEGREPAASRGENKRLSSTSIIDVSFGLRIKYRLSGVLSEY